MQEKESKSTYRLVYIDQINALVNSHCKTCYKNKEKNSLAVESYCALFYGNNGTVAIGQIIADDDSTLRVRLTHTITNKKGSLPEEIPEPRWLCDPSHRVKVVAKQFYA